MPRLILVVFTFTITLIFPHVVFSEVWKLYTNDPPFVQTKEYNEFEGKPVIFGRLVDAPNNNGCHEGGVSPDRMMEFDITIFSRLAGSSFNVNNIFVDGVASGEWASQRWLESFYDNEHVYGVVPLYGNDLGDAKYSGKFKACVGFKPFTTGGGTIPFRNIVLWYDGLIESNIVSTEDGEKDITDPSDSIQVAHNENIIGDLTGNGETSIVKDPVIIDLPDFVTSRVELRQSDIERYRYLPNTNVDSIAWVQNIGDADWAPDEDGKIHDDIEIRYYLSTGYKEDSHSKWQRTGSEYIQRYNLELGDPPKKETDGFTTPSEIGIYNMVVCADRNKDSGNKDGDVLEKHKSNNCSTEAVFEVLQYDLDVFEFSRAHNPIYATGSDGYDNFEARFKIRNNASSTQYIDDMRIDVYLNGKFELTCWQKGFATTIGPSQIHELDKKFCEIPKSGKYHLEAKLKIGGVWRTHQTHPLFDILPALDLEIYDFYQKPEPIYATHGNEIMNFYTGLKIKNNTSVPAIFKWMYIEAYRDGQPIFQCYKKTTATTLQPGEIFDTGHRVCDFWNPGEYNLKLTMHLDSAVGWKTFAVFPPFLVIDAGSSYSDLRVPSMNISKSNVYSEEQVNLSAIVKNYGNVTSTSTSLTFILSTDNHITMADSHLSTKSVNALSANNQTSISATNISSPIKSGIYWIGACVNPVSNESAIQNNCSIAQQLTVSLKPKPDLIVQSPSVDSLTLVVDESFKISATVKNQGNGNAAPTTLRYYLSADNVISISDTQIGTDAVDSLPSNDTSPESIESLISPNTAGTYWVGACVDAVNEESNSENNCSASVEITIVNNLSDLAVTVITSYFMQQINLDYVSNFTINNFGDVSSNPTTVIISFFNTQRTFIAKTVTIPTIAPKSEQQFNHLVTAPNIPGEYTYKICVSTNNNQDAELNNNCMTAETTVIFTPNLDHYENDNTEQQSSKLLSGQTQQHNIVPGADQDWIWFDITNTTEVILETNGQLGDTVLKLYNESLSKIAENDDKGDGSRFSKILIPSLVPGKYYARISSYSASEILSYSLLLTVQSEVSRIDITPILMYLLNKDKLN